MTLTEEAQTDAYAATMENKNAVVENALFDSVASTQYAVPTGFEPTTGADTSNHYVSRLNASINQRVGPTLLLRVMAGDTLTASTYGWYSGTPQAPGSQPSLLNSLGTLLAGNILGLPNSKYVLAEQGALTTAVGPGLTSFLSAKDAAYSSSAPKAFLNWALLDDRFNYISGGVSQVPVITGSMNKQVLTANLPAVIPKNGYLYIYVSNESPQDVFFDNITVQHHRGPLLSESHVYPFGLEMSALSAQAAGKLENKLKYNGKEIQHKEFSDGSGLECEDYGARMYDAQIGRFFIQDAFAEKYYVISPYAYAANDPIFLIDINGDSLNIADLLGGKDGKIDLASLNPVGEDFVKQLEEMTGLTLNYDINGNVTYKTQKGKTAIDKSHKTSRLARRQLKRIINSKTTLSVRDHFGEGSKNYDHENIIYLDGEESEIIQRSMSPSLNKKTENLGMIFFHEFGHTEMGGSWGDPGKTQGYGISDADLLTNRIRRQLGSDYGQVQSYNPYKDVNGNFVIPFDRGSKAALEDLTQGIIRNFPPHSKFITFENAVLK